MCLVSISGFVSIPPNPERLNAMYDTWTAMARMQDYAPYSTVPRDQEPRWWDDDDDEWKETE